jgi:hypothetical protein
MPETDLTPIDNVLTSLDGIINDCILRNDPLGYFACLYRKVTADVKAKIELGYFDDNSRMVALDAVFAQRYLDAYNAYQMHQTPSQAWDTAFSYARNHNGIVLQHLLLGINAHINLDLGIAAAQISTGTSIEPLEDDFNKINQILSDLVEDVQNRLSAIWPFLKKILTRTNQFDDYLIDFSMAIARSGAWEFALELNRMPMADWDTCVHSRDTRITEIASIITRPKTVIQIILWCIRIGERGSVRDKIHKLMARV